MTIPKASDLPEPIEYVRRALGELGAAADSRELAHHAALIAHTEGYEDGYRRGHAFGGTPSPPCWRWRSRRP